MATCAFLWGGGRIVLVAGAHLPAPNVVEGLCLNRARGWFGDVGAQLVLASNLYPLTQTLNIFASLLTICKHGAPRPYTSWHHD
jgi:hypothetical protein